MAANTQNALADTDAQETQEWLDALEAVPGAGTVLIVPKNADNPTVPAGDLLRSVAHYLHPFSGGIMAGNVIAGLTH